MTATRNRFKGDLAGSMSVAGDVATPAREGADLSPFLAIVQGSWDKVQANSTTPATAVNIPVGGETLFVTRCRQAADQLHAASIASGGPALGVSVTHDKAGSTQEHSRMVVLARPRKAAPTTKDGEPITAKKKGMPPVQGKAK